MKFTTQKRIAAQVLRVGTTKVWFSPERLSDIKEAITKSDIRALISAGAIEARKDNQQSKSRARKLKRQKNKGNKKGPGSKKGKVTARLSRKDAWVAKIRVQRKFLSELKQKELLVNSAYKELLAKAKGGFFRNRRHIKLYVEERSLFNKK